MWSENHGRTIVYARSMRRCEMCTRPAFEWHHRVNRSQGGTWAPANGLDLCHYCHQWVTEHPQHARNLGLSLHEGSNPEQWPMWLHPTMWVRRWWKATNEGCWLFAHEPEGFNHQPHIAAALTALHRARNITHMDAA